jgi:hypothetical protein
MIECRSIPGIMHSVRRKLSRSSEHARLFGLSTPLA